MTDTRPGQLSTEEAEKIASGLYNRMKADPEKRTARELLVQWWVADALIVAGICAVLFTGVPILGRVQWMSEAQAQDQKVTKEFGERFDNLEKKVDGLSELVIQQVVSTLASDICRYNMRRTKETDIDERQRLLTQINQMRVRYKQFSGADFNMDYC